MANSPEMLTVPLVILAGSDPNPAALPESGAGLHPIRGYKGMDLMVHGEPLIDRVVDSYVASGEFSAVFIAGPERIYGAGRKGARVIDTDGHVGENLRRAIDAVEQECGPGPLAISACDILPDAKDLNMVMADYRAHAPLDFWFPFITAPEQPQKIGASFWKPRYRIAPEPGAQARDILPGHLAVIDPPALRMSLIYRVLELAYRTRNRPILYRQTVMAFGTLAALLWRDLQNLITLRLPTFTWTVLYHSTALALRLRKGDISAPEMAVSLRKIFVHYRHRKRYPQRGGRLPLMNALSLAKDIDTEEEAREAELKT